MGPARAQRFDSKLDVTSKNRKAKQMLTNIKQRLGRDDEQGFTLIELMVVVLIIAILLAIAIPTFLGAKSSANARAAQSNLRNALTAEQTVWTNGQAFDDTVANLKTAEPNLTWVSETAASATGSSVSVFVGTAPSDFVYLQALGSDKHCYTIVQVNNSALTTPATGYNEGGATCTAPTVTAEPGAVVAGKAGTSANIGSTSYYTSF
jgi:type IV pilus assembly protein PilA